jgi:hypothetical protein
MMVHVIDVAPLFDESATERDRADAAIGAAASTVGVLVIAAPADVVRCDAQARVRLLRGLQPR